MNYDKDARFPGTSFCMEIQLNWVLLELDFRVALITYISLSSHVIFYQKVDETLIFVSFPDLFLAVILGNNGELVHQRLFVLLNKMVQPPS